MWRSRVSVTGLVRALRDATFCMARESREAINQAPTGEQSRVTHRVFVDFERFRFIIIFHRRRAGRRGAAARGRHFTLIMSCPGFC